MLIGFGDVFLFAKCVVNCFKKPAGVAGFFDDDTCGAGVFLKNV